MQAQTRTQPPTTPAAQVEGAAAAAQAQAAPAPKTITVPAADGRTITLTVPLTGPEVRELRRQREELRDQLETVTYRRRSVAEAQRAPGEEVGIAERLRLLDGRIIQLEREIFAIDQQLAAAPNEAIVAAEPPPPPPDGGSEEEVFGVIFGVATFAAFAYGAYRLFKRWRKRRRDRRPAPAMRIESDQRLERLERGMEAIAIEVERISEGQRFVTKLLAETQQPASPTTRVAAPQPQPRESQKTPV